MGWILGKAPRIGHGFKTFSIHLLQLASSDLSGQSGCLSHLQCGAMQLVWLNLYSEHVNSPESQSGAAEMQRMAERHMRKGH